MRIIGGQWRGRGLASVGKGDAAAHLRPTSDRVRESLFNVLGGGRYGDPITDARVLDLFAGTGALGLEAVSRGAASAVFVDTGRKSLSLLRENIALCRAEERSRVVSRDALKLGAWSSEPHDLVFLDPPYGKSLGGKALAHARAQGWIGPNALIVWEENAPSDAPDGFDLLEARSFGGTVLTLLRAEA